ncbi:MAG: chemotaxis protein CheR [Nevskiaceae bacterium]|nr:MAG: chemotaxis protein CheR [Nevskiaceae bacterium]
MSQRDFDYQPRDFRRVRDMIYARAGISLSDAKQDMVYSRLARRLRALKIGAFAPYLDALEADEHSSEWEAFVNALTTNLTSFFRESHHFDQLADFVRKRKATAERPLMIWSSAASTGEEPYSIAMTVIEALNTPTPPVRILATDIDTQVLDTAAAGVYALDRLQNISAARLRRFFLRGRGAHEGYAKVAEPLRRLITFRQLNLLDESWPLRGPFDAIFCRNVMIYFDKPTQRAILTRMRPLLPADGLLFCGHSESFQHATDLFRPCGRSVYAPVTAATAATRPAPIRRVAA